MSLLTVKKVILAGLDPLATYGLKTNVDADNLADQPILLVAATEGFSPGDLIKINRGGAREEERIIDTIQAGESLTMTQNLTYAHTQAQADDVEIYTLNYVVPTAVAGGDHFVNSGRVFIHVKNGGAVDLAVQINTQTPCNQGVDDDADITAIHAGEERMIGPFRKDRFNDASGMCYVICDVQTDILIAAIEVP